MNRISLVIFAPVNGLRAYKYPSMQLVNDDSYGLSDSVLSLAVGASALVLKKITTSHYESCLRLSLHKQVYENGMSRPGHAFGAALDISGSMPSMTSALTVLSGVLDLLDDRCVNSNSFCDKATFEDLLNTLQPVLTRALQDLKDTGKKVLPDLTKSLDRRSSYCYPLKEDILGSEALEVVSWCANTLGGMLCKSLILYRIGMAQPGALVESLPSLEDMSQLGAELLIKEHQETNGQLVSLVEKVAELDKELLQLRASTSSAKTDPSLDALISQVKLTIRDEVKAAFSKNSIKVPAIPNRQSSRSFFLQYKAMVPLWFLVGAIAGAAISYFLML